VPETASGKIEANQSLDFTLFLAELDKSERLRGIRVVYWDGFQMFVIREGPPLCGRDRRCVMVKPDIGETTLLNMEIAERRESKFYQELTNVGVGCGTAIAGWAMTAAFGAATPLTGGSSLFVAQMSAVAGYAGAISCANSGMRLASEAWAPEWNDWLDQSWIYTGVTNALDAIGLMGGVVATATTIKLVLHLSRTTSKSMFQILKGLSRQQRKTLMEELIRANNPGISNAMMKAIMRTGKIPKRFTPLQIEHSVKKQLGEALSALLGFGGSAYDGLVNKAASGNFVENIQPKKPKPATNCGSYVVGTASWIRSCEVSASLCSLPACSSSWQRARERRSDTRS
jgi:hypothetical protein